MEWADFIDYLDSHHELYAKFNDMMSEALDFDKKKAETTDSWISTNFIGYVSVNTAWILNTSWTMQIMKRLRIF